MLHENEIRGLPRGCLRVPDASGRAGRWCWRCIKLAEPHTARTICTTSAQLPGWEVVIRIRNDTAMLHERAMRGRPRACQSNPDASGRAQQQWRRCTRLADPQRARRARTASPQPATWEVVISVSNVTAMLHKRAMRGWSRACQSVPDASGRAGRWPPRCIKLAEPGTARRARMASPQPAMWEMVIRVSNDTAMLLTHTR